MTLFLLGADSFTEKVNGVMPPVPSFLAHVVDGDGRGGVVVGDLGDALDVAVSDTIGVPDGTQRERLVALVQRVAVATGTFTTLLVSPGRNFTKDGPAELKSLAAVAGVGPPTPGWS